MNYREKQENSLFQRKVFISGVCLLILFFAGYRNSQAVNDPVYYFDIQGLRLNMSLDEVIKKYNVDNVKSSKDRYGIINGYEIVKASNGMTLVLNFTGLKRLYRIDFSNRYPDYRGNSEALYNVLKRKYGEPATENIVPVNGRPGDIRACWGTTCSRFSPTTPALKAWIEYETGGVKLTLTDNRIFNQDWKHYKEQHNRRKLGIDKEPDSSKEPLQF